MNHMDNWATEYFQMKAASFTAKISPGDIGRGHTMPTRPPMTDAPKKITAPMETGRGHTMPEQSPPTWNRGQIGG